MKSQKEHSPSTIWGKCGPDSCGLLVTNSSVMGQMDFEMMPLADLKSQ